jgi:fatty acid/phospholipid biosynthesis enzyme
MKTIIVDIPSGLANPTSVLSALKVYQKKNHFYNLLVTGSPNDMSIMEDVEGVRCCYNEGEQTSLDVALSHMNDEGVVGLMSFSTRSLLAKKAHEVFPKEVAPCFGLLYQSKEEGKETFLVDAGGFSSKDKTHVLSYLSYALDYTTNILKKSHPEIAFLALKDNLDDADQEIDDALRQESKDYKGFVDPLALCDGTSDILLAGGKIGAACLASAKGARRIAADLEKIRSSKSVSVKWANLITNKNDTSDARYDARLDAKGYLLFGYGYHLLALNLNAGFGDVMDGFDTLERYDRNQPRRQ